MKFPRNTKIFRGQLEVAPFAGVFFLLVIFLVFASTMVVTPGVPIRLPQARNLPGTLNPTVVVAIDADGQFYYENQLTSAENLKKSLASEVDRAFEPLTLMVHADKNVRYETLVNLAVLAQEVGIKEAWFATQPRSEQPINPVLK